MDVLRSCYRCSMRFYRDADIEAPVEWYFVPEDRELLPFNSSFSSRIYDRDSEPLLPIGERYRPVPWRGGTPPRVVSRGGLCGSADQWAYGARITDPLPEFWPHTTVPKCCKRPYELNQGGLAIGGTPVRTLCCPNDAMPSVIPMTFSVNVGPCFELDGVTIDMRRTDVQCLVIGEFQSFYRSDPMLVGGQAVRWWLGCDGETGLFAVYGSDPDCNLFIFSSLQVMTVTCSPFSLFASSVGIITLGTCEMGQFDVLIEAL